MRGPVPPPGPEPPPHPSGAGGAPPGSWMLHAALAALLLASMGLHLRLGVELLPAILAAFLLFTLPFLSVAQLPLLASTPLDRPGVYAGSAVTLAVLTALALVMGAVGPGLGAMGFGPADPVALGFATLRLGGATAVLVGLFWAVGRLARIPESDLLAELLPRTAHERRLFAGLSVVAGFGEEVVFRGFLLAVLAPALGDPWTALLLSSLAFGVLHVYQGAFGIVRTASLGGLLGVSVLVDGSLWPAVVVHVVVDLVGGLVLGPRTIAPRGGGT